MAEDLEIIKLSDLRDEGKVFADLNPDALILVEQGGITGVSKWSTVSEIINSAVQAAGLGGKINLPVSSDTEQAFSSDTLISHIVVIGTGSGTISCGTSLGGSDVFPAISLVNGKKVVLSVDWYFSSAGSFFFTGSNAILKIYSL